VKNATLVMRQLEPAAVAKATVSAGLAESDSEFLGRLCNLQEVELVSDRMVSSRSLFALIGNGIWPRLALVAVQAL